jgi:hypothetical protein
VLLLQLLAGAIAFVVVVLPLHCVTRRGLVRLSAARCADLWAVRQPRRRPSSATTPALMHPNRPPRQVLARPTRPRKPNRRHPISATPSRHTRDQHA